MPPAPKKLLAELEAMRLAFGPNAAARRRELFASLHRGRLSTAAQVGQLHELLCFCRAYPDDRETLTLVERMLGGFASRSDLKRHAAHLADSGIAGTDIEYRFYASMARWAAERWPDRLHVDWENSEPERIEGILNLLATYSETPALDEIALDVRRWLARLKGPEEADGAFLVRRLDNLGLDGFVHEYFYEHLDAWLVLRAGPDGPSRTAAHFADVPVVFRAAPPDPQRPNLERECGIPPRRLRKVAPATGRRLVDLAREAMITRGRDLDAFAFADERDVTLIDDGDGLAFALIGVLPERRLMFEAVYGYLILRNGVPVGYGVVSSLFESIEVAFNLYETFRGGEAGHLYARLLACLLHVFRADTFTVYPYQLGGDGNDEGLKTGAWWFYQKLGFRSRDRAILRLMRTELVRMKARPRHRSSLAVLRQLVPGNVYLDLAHRREDIIGRLPLGKVGLKITDYLSGRFGSARHLASAVCLREARALLGASGRLPRAAGERLAWERWAPLVLILPGVSDWTEEEKRALVDVIRAKGGRRESAFVAQCDAHPRLREALRQMAKA